MLYQEIPRDVVLYGAGNYCDFFLKHVKACNVKFIIDKDKRNKSGYEVLKITDVEDLNKYFIVITIENYLYRNEVKMLLEDKGMEHYKNFLFADEYLKWEDSELFLDKWKEGIPIFSQIEIETINRCNMHCSFCPCNAESDKRPYAKMSNELFEKIVKELSTIEYAGDITLFSNNEPFLDERTPEFAKQLKASCPNARIIIFTNTTLLTIDIFSRTIPYVDKIVLDNYWKVKPIWNDNVKKIYEYIKDDEDMLAKVVFEMRYQEEILTARAGYAPNKKNASYLVPLGRCSRLFYDFVIRPDGGVSLCCNDAQAQYTLGNVEKDKLVDVWNSDAYMNIRKKMYAEGRQGIYLCNKCDAIYEGAPYSCSESHTRPYDWTQIDSIFLTNNKKDTVKVYKENLDD